MDVYHHIAPLQHALDQARLQTIALVPTMGNLHAGHLALVRLAKERCDVVVVSIFVNPTQFGAGEDFASYPRTLDQDLAQLDGLADIVFAPSDNEMYPTPPTVQVTTKHLSTLLCGRSRPTHFDGVGLIVSKLFNIIRPDVAVFGKKDYQQLAIIRQINTELNFGIDIIGADIVRADDGLALSSRNQYLTKNQRQLAPLLHQSLQTIKQKLKTYGINALPHLLDEQKANLTEHGFLVDYLDAYQSDLTPITQDSKTLVILVAARLGTARLLDNVVVELNDPNNSVIYD